MKAKATLITVVLLLASQALAEETTKQNNDKPSSEVALGKSGGVLSLVKSKFDVSIGGFVKLDYAYNSVNLGPNGALLPNGGAPKSSSIQAGEEQSILTARQSRVWLKVAGPSFQGAKTNALMEVDFYGDNAAAGESPMPRMRHAYGTLDWTNTQLLFGQTSDMFAPALSSTLDFRQGQATGTPFQPRVPQIRLTQKVNLSSDNSLKFIVGVQDPAQSQNTGALVNANGDTGAVSGTAYTAVYSAKPNFAGQIMYTSKSLGTAPGFSGMSMNNFTFGTFGLVGNENFSNATKSVDSLGYGLYTFVPLLSSVDGKSRRMTASFEAQAYYAANMAFNSATAGKVNGAGNQARPAKGYGVYSQIMFYPTEDLGLTTGYERRNAYNYNEYTTANFEKFNELVYANIAYDFNAAIRIAAEYEHQRTSYGRPTAGTSDSGQINTGRLAAYFFF